MFKPEYARAGGSVVAGLVLSQAVYWFKPDYKGRARTRTVYAGELWLSLSYAEWEAACALSKYQISSALQALEAQGILRLRKVMHRNSPRVLVQLDADRLAELVCQNPRSRNLTMTVEGLDCDGEETAPCIEETVLEIEGETVKAAEVIRELEKRRGVLPERLNLVWTKALGETSGRTQKPATNADLAMFKRMGKIMGADAPRVVDRVVRNWTDFVIRVAQDRGIKQTPDVPTLRFLLAHADVAVDWARPEAAKAVTMVPTTTAPPKAPAPTPEEPQMTDPDVVAKALSEYL